jgi:hypothetical protein
MLFEQRAQVIGRFELDGKRVCTLGHARAEQHQADKDTYPEEKTAKHRARSTPHSALDSTRAPRSVAFEAVKSC